MIVGLTKVMCYIQASAKAKSGLGMSCQLPMPTGMFSIRD